MLVYSAKLNDSELSNGNYELRYDPLIIDKKFSIHDIKNKISERSKPNLGWASDFAKCGTKLVERGRELGRDKSVKQKLHGFLIMKYKDDLLGTGKASENKITNFIPKSRRLKERS